MYRVRAVRSAVGTTGLHLRAERPALVDGSLALTPGMLGNHQHAGRCVGLVFLAGILPRRRRVVCTLVKCFALCFPRHVPAVE